MARAGILYSQVAQAASQLVAGGKNPTIDTVRVALGGTGSKSTIAPMLKRWKAEHEGSLVAADSGLPQPLLDALKGVYEHMQATLAQQLDQSKQAHADELHAVTEREKALQAQLAAALADRQHLNGELGQTRSELSQLQATHQAQSVALASTQSENAGLERRLADRAAEVTTLDRQLTQARAQFEHYQETTAAQHAKERRNYEQRLAKLDHDLAGANRLLTLEQSARSQQDARMTQLTTDHKAQQEALRAAVDELNDVRSAREHLAERLAEATSARQSLAEQLAANQQHLTDAKIAQASLEQRVGILVEQVARAEARTERLAEEKIVLLQGKATLEQQLKHASLQAGAQ